LRIISDFKDFYDCGQGAGDFDDDVVYLRKTEKIVAKPNKVWLPNFPTFSLNDWRSAGDRLDVETFIVGFCGKVYPIVRVCHSEKDKQGNHTKPHAFIFKVEDLDAYIAAHFSKTAFEDYKNPSQSKWAKRKFNWYQSRGEYQKFLERNPPGNPGYQRVFDEYNCPIFLRTYSWWASIGDSLYINPLLKTYQFYRYINPYTAFQELAMYWGGKAQPNKPIPEMDDATKIEQHGLDPKWSFRKPPT
jgi:hypothetical protein